MPMKQKFELSQNDNFDDYLSPKQPKDNLNFIENNQEGFFNKQCNQAINTCQYKYINSGKTHLQPSDQNDFQSSLKQNQRMRFQENQENQEKRQQGYVQGQKQDYRQDYRQGYKLGYKQGQMQSQNRQNRKKRGQKKKKRGQKKKKRGQKKKKIYKKGWKIQKRQKKQDQKHGKQKEKRHNIFATLTKGILTSLEQIKIQKTQTSLFQSLKNIKTFVQFKKDETNKQGPKPKLPIRHSMSSNVIVLIIIVYQFCKSLNVNPLYPQQIVTSLIRSIKYKLVRFIFCHSHQKKLNKSKALKIRKNLFFFYDKLQSNLADLKNLYPADLKNQYPTKLIEQVIALVFQKQCKKKDIKLCEDQIKVVYEKTTKQPKQFDGLIMLPDKGQNYQHNNQTLQQAGRNIHQM